jgi:hypothetical protein
MGFNEIVERSSLNEQQKVGKLVEKHFDSSFLNSGVKGKRKFEGLTKLEKRQWREALQRAIAACKNRSVVRALAGNRVRGKTKHKIQHLSRREEALYQFMHEDVVELQAGRTAAVAGALVGSGALIHVARSASKACDKIGAAAEQSSNIIEELGNRFKTMLKQLQDMGGWFFKIAAASCAFWLCMRFSDSPLIVGVFIAGLAAFAPDLVKFVQDAIGVHQQSGGMSVGGIAALLCALLVPTGKVPRFVGEFTKSMAFFPKVSEGLEVFVEKSMRAAESLINFVLRRDKNTWIDVGRKKTLVEKWRIECLHICAAFDANPTPDREVVKSASKKVQEGYGFLALFTSNDVKREISVWLDKLNARLAPHLATLTAEHNVRVMPWFALFGGESAVGKTSMVQAYASFVLLLAGSAKAADVLPNLWQKGISEYWNGYLGQRAIIKDDCFQVRGVAGQQDSEAMEVIRTVGNWACPLNFADVLSKGRHYFDADLIVGTTNAKNIRADWEPFIASPDALIRRFQGAYWLEIDPAWDPNGKFDFYRVQEVYRENLERFLDRRQKEPDWKPTEDDVLSIFPWHIWRVRRHTYDNTNPLSGPILEGGLKQAVREAAEEIKRRKALHVRSVETLNSHLHLVQEALDGLELQNGGEAQSSGVGLDLQGLMARFSAVSVEQWRDTLDEPEPVDVEVDLIPQDDTIPRNDGLHNLRAQLALERELRAQRDALRPMDTTEDEDEQSFVRTFVESFKSSMQVMYGRMGIAGIALGAVSSGIVLKAVFGIISGIIKTFWSVVKAIASLFGIRPKVVEQSNDVAPKEKKSARTFDFPSVDLQLGNPPQEGVHEAIWRNMYAIELCFEDPGVDDVHLGTMLGIGDSVYLMPRHFLTRISQEKDTKGASVRITLAHQVTHKVSFKVDVFLKFAIAHLDGFDMVGISLGRLAGLRANRNIVKYFLSSHELANVLRGSNVPVRLDVIRKSASGLARHTMHSSGMEYTGTVKSAAGVQMRGCVSYEMPTVAGDCGGPLTLEENRFYGGRAIVGLHVAGKSGYFGRKGYTTIIPKETVKEIWLMMTDVRDLSDNVTDDILWMGSGEFVDTQNGLLEAGLVGGSVTYLGDVAKPLNVATKTSYHVSPMQEDELFGPAPTAPAPLRAVWRDEQKINPMAKAVEAYQSPVLYRDPEELRPVSALAFMPLFKATRAYPRDILTFEEALEPPEGWRLKPINRRTSAGYKYRDKIPALTTYPGKIWFLGFDGPIDMSNSALDVLREDVSALVEHARRGERVLHIFTDFLKDELRPLEKVQSVKTRMISGAELDYVVAVRMYFGAFQSAMFSTRVINGMSPGVNHYTEWSELAERLVSKGGKVFDGDFTRYDASEQPWVHAEILDTINRWYSQKPGWSKEDDVVRKVLWEDLIHSRHLTGTGPQLKHLVQWHKSLPSGHPLTTVVNSMYSLLTITASYMKLTGDAVNMWDHVFINTFGDDNVTGVDDETCEVFNQVTLGPVLHEAFGLTYTPALKDGVPVAYTTIDRISFLQRGFLEDDDTDSFFVKCPNVGWVAPLNPNSFMYTPYWYRNARDPKADIADNCDKLVCELALHTESKWNEVFPRLEQWCSKNDITLKFADRSAARAHIKTRLDVWF